MEAQHLGGEKQPPMSPTCPGCSWSRVSGLQDGPQPDWLPVQLCLQAAIRLFARHLKKQTALLLTLSPNSIVVIGRQPPAASQAS